MIIHEVKQGSEQWHALRATTRNASEAPAMMGVSKYKSRPALIAEKATGIIPEIDAATQRRFDAGHETEAKARAILEQKLGEDLYPLVATDDECYLLASSDGSDMCRTFGFEHKLWNADFADQVAAGEVPDSHKWQLDQQIEVFGFEKIIFVCSDGTTDNFVSCEYRTTPQRIAKLRAGWKMFDQDVANYQSEVIEAKPILHANPIDNLPALFIEVTGRVTASNLVEFKAAATAVISSIKTELVTDQDFVDATATVKYLKDVEDSTKRAKQNALDQTTSIAELHRALDEVAGMAATVRKALDKKVVEEKDRRKVEIVMAANQELVNHIMKMNERIGAAYMPRIEGGFAESIKGLKSLDSMRDKVSVALANAKIEANATADRIDANLKSLEADGQNWRFLFPDLQAVCTKTADDFAALLAARKASHAAAESARIENIRAEEQAKAAAKVKAEQEAEDALIKSLWINANRIEFDSVPYIEKAIAAFETGAKDWENDPRHRVSAAVAEARKQMQERLTAAKERAEAKRIADAEKAEADRAAAEEIRKIDEQRKAAALVEAEKLAAEAKTVIPVVAQKQEVADVSLTHEGNKSGRNDMKRLQFRSELISRIDAMNAVQMANLIAYLDAQVIRERMAA